ncbi:MAG: MarR family transcriptional regulator [Bacteroidetes bacterium]|nr:MAG: MarR family transcriptional regulator [Bacteroidota bacterium]
MKLEDAIQQWTFINEYQKAHLNILLTASTLNQRTTSLLKPYGLTWQQFNILRILRGQYPKPATVKLLTERMIDKMSNASRLVDKLVDKGLVKRTPCTDDRRRVDVAITDKGLVLLAEVSERLESGLNFEQGHLSEAEAIQLNELLDRFRGD